MIAVILRAMIRMTILILFFQSPNSIWAQSFHLTDTTFTVGSELIHGTLYNPNCQLNITDLSFLDSLANLILRNKQISIEIELHTDIRGSEESNLRRTEVCGKSRLMDYFQSKDPKLMERITFKCLGESQPIFTKKEIEKILNTAESEKAHLANSRTVIKITQIAD